MYCIASAYAFCLRQAAAQLLKRSVVDDKQLVLQFFHAGLVVWAGRSRAS